MELTPFSWRQKPEQQLPKEPSALQVLPRSMQVNLLTSWGAATLAETAAAPMTTAKMVAKNFILNELD